MNDRITMVADIEKSEPALAPALMRFIYDLRERLPMFIVYDHPRDFPDCYVARMWISLPQPTAIELVLRSSDLEPMRDFLDRLGLTHLDRSADDDPKILETWL